MRSSGALGGIKAGLDLVRSDRFAAIGFAACVLAAIPVYMILGSDMWFCCDEWTFISVRSLTAEGILSNHSGHWVTLPFLAFRGIYQLVGLHSYAPYQLLSVLSHVSIVILNYLLMCRMKVQSWLAFAVACTLLFFGAGAFNIFLAFQITLNGSVLCGLIFLLLVDHEGPIDQRNIAGVIIAIIGLMTSAVMVPMIIGVFTALLLRRGPVIATLHIAPPAAVFVSWYVLYGTSQPENRGTLGQTLEMIVRLTTETLSALGQSTAVGVVLGVVILFGLWCAGREAVRGQKGAPLAIPAALLVSWISFSVAASLRAGNLSFDPDLPGESRYVYVGAALLLPLIAYGGLCLARVRLILALVPVIALALGVPSNIDALVNPSSTALRGSIQFRKAFLAVVHSRLIGQVSGDFQPFIGGYVGTTVDWMRLALANGDIPNRGVIDDEDQLFGDALLALRPDPSAAATCVPKPGRLTMTAHAGDIIKLNGGRNFLVSLTDGHTKSKPIPFSWVSRFLVIQAGPVDIEISSPDSHFDPLVCIERRR